MPTDEPKTGTDNLANTKPSPTPTTGRITATTAPTQTAGAAKPAASNGVWVIVKWSVLGVIGLVVLVFALAFGIPWIIEALTTESTDDAYVNGHVTFVAPRVAGQVVTVLVDDNNRVHKGDLIVQLDKEPYQVQVDLKKAIFAQAKADLEVTKDQVRGQVALARSNRFKLQHTIEDVNNQIALLRANVAAWETTKARLARAKADYDRGKELSKTPGAISKQDLDLKLQDFQVAEAQVKQALEVVYQTRVGLGLPTKPEKGEDLTQVPSNLDQTFSTVRQAAAALLQSAAPLGVFPSSYDLKPREILEEFYWRDPALFSEKVNAYVTIALQHQPLAAVSWSSYFLTVPHQSDVDRIYAQIIRDAPAIKQFQAKLEQAEQDLEQAKLNLRYCDVYAEIDGVVTRRNVNPGNNVQAGQSLMAIRSLTEIWIDANFKETQLRELRIGQQVRIEVDMYGSHRTYEGRITGFEMGTGQTLSLLPPQNATGNFVKIVQRLPVRIEVGHYDRSKDPPVFIPYDPDKDPPLFVGLSVEPHVYIKKPATGPDAGKVLQPNLFTTPPDREVKP